VNGNSAGRWLFDDLADMSLPIVGHQVPQCFECYIRILHPASDVDGQTTRWSDVAHRNGRVIHPEVQWHCLVGSPNPRQAGEHRGGALPAFGEMSGFELDVLCAYLQRNTATSENCFFGLSTIHGWVTPLVARGGLLGLAYRQFAVFSGPLKSAGELGIEDHLAVPRSAEPPFTDRHSGLRAVYPAGDGEPPSLTREGLQSGSRETPGESIKLQYLNGVEGQAPNLMWPDDRAWFLASELLATSELECLAVDPADSLDENADHIIADSIQRTAWPVGVPGELRSYVSRRCHCNAAGHAVNGGSR
jgi:hypothetical protein